MAAVLLTKRKKGMHRERRERRGGGETERERRARVMAPKGPDYIAKGEGKEALPLVCKVQGKGWDIPTMPATGRDQGMLEEPGRPGLL